MENIVLGGGLAGLIYAFYNKDFKVIAEKVGGQSVGSFTLGPRIIQRHELTARLLNDLGFRTFIPENQYDFTKHRKPAIIKTAKIGYWTSLGVMQTIQDEEYRKRYYAKSRCLTLAEVENIPDAIMSDNKNSIEYFAISHEQLAQLLIEELKKQNRIFQGRVNQVDLEESLLHVIVDGSAKTLKYNKLVNTSPFPIFFKLCNQLLQLQDEAFAYESKYFINVDKFEFKEYLESGFDYIYYPQMTKEVPFHRITQGEQNVIVEITGKSNYEIFHEKYKHLEWSMNELKIGQIKQNFNLVAMEIDNVTIENVRNIGRFAQWNHEIKTQQVVETSLKGLW